MDSNEIRKKWELDQYRAFCKQSCNKIDQGLDKLDPRSRERAIWELFQNARDLARTDDNGKKTTHIKIKLTPTEFIFMHQGQAFNHDSLTSLVMQVSSEGKENDETVGQYGTGFITTHVFGRRLKVTGSMDMEKYASGSYVDINSFVIDRTYDNIGDFIDKVAHQLSAVNDFADVQITSSCREWTELSYDLSSMEGASKNAEVAIASSVNVIPYVMTVNKPISDVIIENQITNDFYKFEKTQLPDEEELKVMQISVTHNGETEKRKIFYLESEDGEDMAILPLEEIHKARSLKGIAKLFVFFPLLGTEKFGMDVVFHSKKFIPVEERNGLHLPSSNVNARQKYEQNVRVLNSLTDMVHSYYRKHAGGISNWMEISELSFDCEHHEEDVTKDFFRTFKNKWSSFFQNLPIIDYQGERVCVNGSNIRFFSQGIISDITDDEIGETYFTPLYDACAHVCQMADKHEIVAWSKVVASWDASHPSMIEVEEIAQRVGENDDISSSILLAFDTYLSKKENNAMFDMYDLIPNREGTKKKRAELYDASTIPQWLGDIAKTLVPEKTKCFADDRFVSIVGMSSFTRNDLRDAISNYLRTIRQDRLEKGELYERPVLQALLQLSSLFRSETYAEIRRNTIKIIAEHLSMSNDVRVLAPLDSNECDLGELPFKHLVECMLLEISKNKSEWVKSNMNYIYSLHLSLSKWSEYYNRNIQDGLCVKYGAFPSRNGNPTLVRELEKGLDVPEELSMLYQEVIGTDINDRLVDAHFESFYNFKELSAKDVAAEIEKHLEENGFHDSAVLDIIKSFDKDSCWERWFPHIAAKKAELFLNHVHEECKDSVFKLMKIDDPDKLKQLAELADEVDLDEIINKGRASIILKRNEEADFKFKKELGTYVEEMIQQHLSESIAANEVTVETEQYGSDISICKSGIPIYYIEVKSRWGIDQSVMMSPLQVRTSVREQNNYALCCVDMSHLNLSEVDEHVYPKLEETLPFIKVLTNIGSLNEELYAVATGSDNRLVHIGDEFKCVVPQKTILEQGVSFTSLIDEIISKI